MVRVACGSLTQAAVTDLRIAVAARSSENINVAAFRHDRNGTGSDSGEAPPISSLPNLGVRVLTQASLKSQPRERLDANCSRDIRYNTCYTAVTDPGVGVGGTATLESHAASLGEHRDHPGTGDTGDWHSPNQSVTPGDGSAAEHVHGITEHGGGSGKGAKSCRSGGRAHRDDCAIATVGIGDSDQVVCDIDISNDFRRRDRQWIYERGVCRIPAADYGGVAAATVLYRSRDRYVVFRKDSKIIG